MARTKGFDETEVLTKAIQLFWHKGYNGTSMQDLVAALGISRSSLYDTYTDKHTLFLKALESYQKSGSLALQKLIDETDSAKETIKKLFEITTIQLISDKQNKGCFMVNAEVEVAPHDPSVSDMVCKNDQQTEDAFYSVIKKGQSTGEIQNTQDARALAKFVFNTVKGMRVTAKSTMDQTAFNDIIELTLSTLKFN
jgi:TetR/AcrR family transcriptional repressor of nem operon